MSDRMTIAFTPTKVRRLRKQYDAAVKQGLSQFTFETGEPEDKGPHELVTAYAKYLLEYLEPRMS